MAEFPSWSVRFCFGDTQEDNVKMEVGRGGDADSHRLWKNVNPSLERQVPFPEDLRYANEIWIKLTAVNGKDVHACIKYDDNDTQKMTFDEEEEHETSRDNRDDCGC